MIVARLLSETTTTGVRFHEMHRKLLQREQIRVATVYGDVSAKRIRTLDGAFRVVPEYDACRDIAKRLNLPIRTVYDTIAKSIERS